VGLQGREKSLMIRFDTMPACDTTRRRQ